MKLVVFATFAISNSRWWVGGPSVSAEPRDSADKVQGKETINPKPQSGHVHAMGSTEAQTNAFGILILYCVTLHYLKILLSDRCFVMF